MQRRLAFAALVAAVFFGGTALVSSPGASRNTEDRDARLVAASVLFDRHGEPRLAWETLRDAKQTDPRLAARLLTEIGRFTAADSLLALITGGDANREFADRLQRARLNTAAERFQVARELLGAGAAPTPALEAYRQYLLGRVRLALADPAGAITALEAAEKTGDTPAALRAPLAVERMRASQALGRPRDAMAAADVAIQHTDDARARRELLWARYQLARDAGDGPEALRGARRLFDDSKSSQEAGACAGDLMERDAATLSDAMLTSCAEVFSARGETTGLRGVLRQLDRRELSAGDIERRRITWAEYHYQTGDWSRAIALARPSYSDASLRRRSMLVMARSLRKLGQASDAAAVYEQFTRTYPNDGLAAEALYTAASLYERDNRDVDAARVLDQLRRSYPSTFHGWAAAMRRADELSSRGDGTSAADIYNQWLARSRRTDEAALFYLARERERREKGAGASILEELRGLNPYSFYVAPDVATVERGPLVSAAGAMRSTGAGSLSEWLTRADETREAAWQRVKASADHDDPAAAVQSAVARAELFLDAGLRGWGEAELENARRTRGISAGTVLEIARLYESNAMPWRSVRVYEHARVRMSWQDRREHVDDFRYLTYPLPYPAQVLDSAARNGVPAHLVYGMIREESRFEADVVSRAGAVGLMQLMPQTARRVAAQMDVVLDVEGRLEEPAVNVSLGVWYAADLLKAGDGSAAWMLAAYNAGPGAADRWLRPGVAGDGAIDAVESIDYKETRGYVKRVIESANVYHDLYFGGTR
jgi:soluble lytic murein transglycosylase